VLRMPARRFSPWAGHVRKCIPNENSDAPFIRKELGLSRKLNLRGLAKTVGLEANLVTTGVHDFQKNLIQL
jgi:hypothetical protein